jgi:hypothetical protein
MSNNNSSSGGIGFSTLLAILFIGLKLGHVINWPWIWVLSPLWLGLAIGLTFAIIAFLFVALVAWLGNK